VRTQPDGKMMVGKMISPIILPLIILPVPGFASLVKLFGRTDCEGCNVLFLKCVSRPMKTCLGWIGGWVWLVGTVLAAEAGTMRVVESRMFWSEAPHNAFTDLHRQQGRWYCAFREGAAHVSPDGAVRILSSDDGREGRSAFVAIE
jgi:hypothetical protein